MLSLEDDFHEAVEEPEALSTPVTTVDAAPPPATTSVTPAVLESMKPYAPHVSASDVVTDTIPARTSAEQTLFSRAPAKFTEIVINSKKEIPAVAFLNACEAILTVFDVLGSTAFAPVKGDINGNIAKLRGKISTNPAKLTTLQSIVLAEIEA
jgi:hypothetical protein